MSKGPLDMSDKMGDIMSSLLGPPNLYSSQAEWNQWEEKVKGFAAMAGENSGQHVMESTINIMTKIAIGERRKSNGEMAIKIFKRCEELTQIYDDNVSKLCFLQTIFNTGFCLHYLKLNRQALKKLESVKKILCDFLNLNLIGQKITLEGLKKGAHLNGKVGTIVHLNLKPNRHGIKLLSSGRIISINILNLKIFVEHGTKKDVHVLLGKTFHYLGEAYVSCDNEEKANENYTKALKFFSSANYTEKSMDLIHFCGSYLEFIQVRYGNVTKILEMHDFHLKTIVNICGTDSPHYAAALNCKGNYFLHYKHDFDSALELFTQANRITPHQDARKAQLMLNLVNAYERKQDFKNALKYAKIGVQIARECLPRNHELTKGLEDELEGLKSPLERKMMLTLMEKIIEEEKEKSKNLPKLSRTQKKLIRYMIIDRRCGFCAEVKEGLRACVGCDSIYYCSTEHQKLHWKKHKKQCKKIQKQRRLEEEEEEEEEAEN